MNPFKKLEDETVEEYILRLSNEKNSDKSITWQGIANALGMEFKIFKSEAWVRKEAKSLLCSENEEEMMLTSIIDAKQEMQEKILTLQKEKIKIADERAQNNAYIRRLARAETYKEIALEVVKEISKTKMLPKYDLHDECIIKGDKEAILCIGDWHYGIEFKNPWNEFNPEICKERVYKLQNKAIKYIIENKCKHLHLVNLQDLIAGRIHLGLRLESRFDVITQTIHVSEILAEFITNLSRHVPVTYYDCLDNHSRLEPNKNEAQDLESLARMIPWYLKERLKDNSRVSFKENEFGHDLITFETIGYSVVATHGDKDNTSTIIQGLNSFCEHKFDLVLMGHRHHTSMDESCNTLLVCNGSVMGTDSYAKNLRLNSPPSQNLIIVSKENPMEVFYRITL